jgi:hypothetical protein
MVVAELITRLQAMPANAPVVLNMGQNELANGLEIREVEPVIAIQNRAFLDYLPKGERSEDNEYCFPSRIVVNLSS